VERVLSELLTPEIGKTIGFIETRRVPDAAIDPLVTGLEYDSRKIQPGNLYFALPGLHADGHAFIPEAIRRGAPVVVHEAELSGYPPGVAFVRVRSSRFAMSALADRFYGSPSRSLALIGVTGTEGKSTTVYLIHQLLEAAGKKAGFISTAQYSEGDGERWNPEHQTTPEATVIHRFLRLMRDKGAEYAVLEASSHGLSPRTNRLGDAAFDAGVMTNVAHEHLEFHGTWEQYRHDKANLFRAIGKTAKTFRPWGNSGGEAAGPARPGPPFGVVNGDDGSASYFAEAAAYPVYRFSVRDAPADLSLQSLESAAEGNRYRLKIQETGETLEFYDRLPGAFNAGNVLAALLTLSRLLGAPVRDFLPLVPSLKPVRGRMTAVQKGQPFEALVDFAHTPSSFSALFPPLRERLDRRGGRIISLFGSAGERDTAKRPEQGRIASRWSDILFLTDEDPRGEPPEAILEAIAQGVREETPGRREGVDMFLIPHRPAAIRAAFSLARPGDLVLLLGKGHENSILYAGYTLPYDEISEAEQALSELGYPRSVT
jgi:UDP-N-acetylmuramoyl-L-alanyl-D-glutamate--2,6-diaminopimelate ligase